jgi:amidase
MNVEAANNQNGLLRGLACNLTEREYQERLRFARGAAREDGIDKTLKEYQVDIIIGPGDGPLFKVAGSAG